MRNLVIELLQIAVGTREQFSRVPTDSEWKEIFKFADRHSLIGVLFGGVEKLPADQRPPMSVLMNWIGKTEYIRNYNTLLNARCEEITREFTSAGFRSCILKGQANATYYPLPELRSPGDIDIWVSPSREDCHGLEHDRKIVAQYVIDHEADYERMQYHHIDYHVFSDVEVEVHFCPTVLFNYRKNEMLQARFRSEKTACFENWNVEHSFCTMLPRTNALMQLVHMYRHLFDGGVSLKQIVDFYYLLVEISIKYGDDLQLRIREDVNRLGLYKFSSAISYVIKEVFLNGSDDSILIATPNSKYGKQILDEIFAIREKVGRVEKSKLENFTSSIAMNSRLWRYYPSDCIWNIAYRLSQYFWRKRNGWK